MAINKNHEFEELNGVKCAIVEKNASKERVDFLKPLLEFNKFTVVIVAAPPSKPAPAPVAPKVEAPAANTGTAEPIATDPPQPPAPPPPVPELFTIGVTDVMFNPINAIFGRLLRTPDGHVVTLGYWQQQEKVAKDDVPYFDARK